MKRMMSCFVFVGLLFATMAMAVPSTMSIQGHLANGGVSMNGDHTTIFRLFDAEIAGNNVWSEQDTIHVASYLYSSILGQNVPLPTSIFSQQLWLETTVDGMTLSPRIKLTSSPSSLHAQYADTAAVALNGTMTGGQWESNGTDVWRMSGNIGVGLNNPSVKLDMSGNLKIRLDALGNNSGMSFNAAAESPSIGFHASDNSPRFTLATQFTGNNLDDLLRFNGNPIGSILVLKGNGNVGIGTSSPGQLLHVENGSGMGAAILVRSNVPGTGSFGRLQFQNVLATDGGIAAEIEAVRPTANWGQESDLLFKTSPGGASPSLTERMRITKDGKVGIGTSNPLDFFEVAGNSMTIGAYDGTLNDVVLRAAGGCPNCGSNSEGGSNLVLRAGIGTGAAASGDIVFQVSDNVNYGNQQPHGILEGMRIHTSTREVTIPGDLNIGGSMNVIGTKCRVFNGLKINAFESGHALFMDDEPTARLVDGKCRVNLSPKFMSTVTVNGKYPLAVNVTIYGRHGADWYVERDSTGFTVIDPSGGNNEFSWQAIVRQKGYEDTYLDPVETQTAKK